MAFINQHLLADSGLYEFIIGVFPELLAGSVSDLPENEIKGRVYAAWQKRYYTWPDQVFLGHWHNLCARKKEAGGWCNSVLGQAARYHFECDNRRLSIRLDKFDQWQAWIADQSGLPVIAYKLAQQMRPTVLEKPFELLVELKQRVGCSALVSPYHSVVQDYIQRNGLHEAHMHLNGTTLAEDTWLHALLHPQKVTENLTDKYHDNEHVKLLYAANSILGKPNEMYKLLQLARLLRELILAWLGGNAQDCKGAKQDVCHILGAVNGCELSSHFWHEKKLFNNMANLEHIAELHWQVRLIARLSKETDPVIDTCYWLYMLCMNNFQKFSVQRSDQYGFDCFQKFADNGIRDEAELTYLARFKQLRGCIGSGEPEIATLECRFAPKASNSENMDLLEAILKGFLHSDEGENAVKDADDINALALRVLDVNKPVLRLVAHFIKKPWNPSSGEPHYQALREGLNNRAALLIELLSSMPALKKIITGIDAAANEVDTPPEVFAALYRYCRYHGMQHFTYHAGEDFEHLLSGVRAVYDALTCLNLCNGDRLGHATAIGIDPALWLQSMPEKAYIKRGQRLDDLLFLRMVAFDTPNKVLRLDRIERNIRILIATIFTEPEVHCITIDRLQDAFLYRGLSPECVKSYLDNTSITYTGWMAEEVNEVRKVEQDLGRGVLECLELRWFDLGVLTRSEEFLEVDLAEEGEAVLIAAQQYVQHRVAKAKVVIETLPTSNVRIGHYQSMEQHHLFRWLQLPSRTKEGDAHLQLALGSDDPGIFATSLKNEFYHIFCTLINSFDINAQQALNIVAGINENGRIYRFDEASLI